MRAAPLWALPRGLIVLLGLPAGVIAAAGIQVMAWLVGRGQGRRPPSARIPKPAVPVVRPDARPVERPVPPRGRGPVVSHAGPPRGRPRWQRRRRCSPSRCHGGPPRRCAAGRRPARRTTPRSGPRRMGDDRATWMQPGWPTLGPRRKSPTPLWTRRPSARSSRDTTHAIRFPPPRKKNSRTAYGSHAV